MATYAWRWNGQRNNTGSTNIAWDRKHRPMRSVRLSPTSRYLGVNRTKGTA